MHQSILPRETWWRELPLPSRLQGIPETPVTNFLIDERSLYSDPWEFKVEYAADFDPFASHFYKETEVKGSTFYLSYFTGIIGADRHLSFAPRPPVAAVPVGISGAKVWMLWTNFLVIAQYCRPDLRPILARKHNVEYLTLAERNAPPKGFDIEDEVA